MPLTPAITFRRVRRSGGLEAEILTRVHALERYYPRITGCRVLVEPGQRRHEAGNRYHVRIDLAVPGEAIVVAHEAGQHAAAQDVHARKLTKAAEADPARKYLRVAIRDAFGIARRRLQDYARRQHDRAAAPARRRRAMRRVHRASPAAAGARAVR